MKLRRIDVLLNEETKELFNEGDIVKIKTKGTYGREYIGKIKHINTLEAVLDTSEKFESYTNEIKYEDIQKIEIYKRPKQQCNK